MGSGKTNVLLNLTKYYITQPDTDKIDLTSKDPFESKYQLFINRTEKIGIKKLRNPKAFTDYWQTIAEIYENLEDYNPAKKSVNIVFHDMILDTEPNKKLYPIVTELFSRGRKVNISLVLYQNLISKCLRL